MLAVHVKSYAKINLTLDLCGVRGGYHMIDSVVTTVDISDLLLVRKRKDKNVTVIMHGEGSEAIPPESNNALIAAEKFIKAFGTDGADITVWKNIPMGAGLGGSSADAAGVLRGMARLYGVDDFSAVKTVADEVGSDCGYMLYGGYARLTDRGVSIKFLESGLQFYTGILVPRSGVSTAQCYALSDSFPVSKHTSDMAEKAVRSGDLTGLCASLGNGLYGAAAALNTDVEEAYSALSSFDPSGVNMTGSGSGVCAIFENDAFARYAQSRYTGRHRFIIAKTYIPTRERKEEDNG